MTRSGWADTMEVAAIGWTGDTRSLLPPLSLSLFVPSFSLSLRHSFSFSLHPSYVYRLPVVTFPYLLTRETLPVLSSHPLSFSLLFSYVSRALVSQRCRSLRYVFPCNANRLAQGKPPIRIPGMVNS